jgi:uncharacterized membrane protein
MAVMEFVTSLLGRLHPLLVHLPIGILLLAFIFEWLAIKKRFEYLKPAVQLSLLIGAVSATASCITGYLLSLEGGYRETLLLQHQYLGIATAVLSFALFLLRSTSVAHRFKQKYAGLLLFAPVISVLSVTGHLGGSLTHGDDFLSVEVAASQIETAFKPIVNIDSAIVYKDVVQPILQSKCYSCHSSKKQKGGLRLDEIEFIRQGGEHGKIIVDGLPDSSALYTVLLLPLEDERHMPPKGKPQPTSTEIAILQSWIEEGANIEKRVRDLAKPDKMKTYIASLQSVATQHWVPTDKVIEPDQQTITTLKSRGILVLPVAQESNYIMINFVNKKTVTNEDLNSLLALKAQLLWLRLDGTTITDEQLAIISNLENLRWLYVNNTTISDNGLISLAKLPQVQFINLVNTAVTDKGLGNLASVEKLQKLFVYKTKVSAAGIESFRIHSPNVQIDTGGYSLPKRVSDSIVYKRER